MGFLKNLSARSRNLLFITFLLAVLIPLTVYSSLQRKNQVTQAATQTINLTVSNGADDAYQTSSLVLSTTVFLMMDSSSYPASRYASGFRFTNISIPKGSTINSANLQLYVYSIGYDDPNVNIYGNAVSNAQNFSAEATITNRALTGSSVPWVATSIGVGYKTSPDIKNVINEIVNNQPGWSSGNAIALLLIGKTDSIRRFWARGYEYTGSAAKLTITYTLPVPTATITANDSGGPISINYNTSATIKWSSTNANSCSVSPTGWTGTSNTSGVSTGNLTSSKTYTLSCSGDGGSASDSVTVNVNPPPKPTVTISTNPSSISSGQSSTITWSCTPNDGTVSVSITANPPPNIGTSLSCSGSRSITPSQSVSYTAIATGPVSSSDAKSASITVNGQPPPAPPSPKKPSKSSVINPSTSTFETLQLEISVPNLKGKEPFKIELAGSSKEIQIESSSPKTYSLNWKEAQLSLGQEYTLIVRSEKSLIKKVKFTPQSTETKLNLGDLVLGDLNQDNYISFVDQTALVSFIASQDSLGDLNGDGHINSFDWAILWENFGKKGD